MKFSLQYFLTISFGIIVSILLNWSCKNPGSREVLIPHLEGQGWKITGTPNLDSLNGKDLDRQHIVDHGIIQKPNGKWLLWACIRGALPGRLLYGWEGDSLQSGPWKPLGIVARADSTWDEKVNPESIQAPYFIKSDSAYLCFYNSNGIRLMTAQDGNDFRRVPIRNSFNNILYEAGGRDVMVMPHDSLFYAYSTISKVSRDGWLSGFIILRTSPDLIQWSDYTVVNEGGIAGNGPVSAESPFVVQYQGYFYLFRTSSNTGKCYVYRSESPWHFGVNDDSKLVAVLPVKAPEVFKHQDQWYITDLDDFKGIRLHRLNWIAAKGLNH